MTHREFSHAPMDLNLRRAGMVRAWAIVRPFPGKEGLLLGLLGELGWEFRRPTLLANRRIPRSSRLVPYEIAALPGYVFVRPPVGSRSGLQYLPHVSDVRPVVVFDQVLMQVEVEVARVRAEKASQAAAPSARARRKKWRPEQPDQRIVSDGERSAFERLAAMLGVERRAIDVDKGDKSANHSEPIRESAAWLGTLDEYFGTDVSGEDCSERKCGTLVRRRMYFN